MSRQRNSNTPFQKPGILGEIVRAQLYTGSFLRPFFSKATEILYDRDERQSHKNFFFVKGKLGENIFTTVTEKSVAQRAKLVGWSVG